MVSLDIAIEYPGLVKKLVLGSTAAEIGDKEYQVIADWAALAKAGDATKVYHDRGKLREGH